MDCPRCSAQLPEVAHFCHVCGQDLRSGDAERRRSFAARPDEPVASFALFSSIMPRGSGQRPQTYRIALTVALVVALVAATVGAMPIAVLVAAFAVPIVYVVYLYDVNLWEDEPLPVTGLAFALTGVLAIAWTLLWTQLRGTVAFATPTYDGSVSAAPAVSRPARTRRSACRRASDSATSASASAGGGWARQVPTTTRRPCCTVSTSSRSTRSEDLSDQCRSSSRTRSGRSAAASRTASATASHERNCAPSSSRCRGSLRGSCCPRPARTGRHGHRGGAPSSWEQRPDSTLNPRATASSASSVVSLVLPIPGSPVTAANPGRSRSAPSRSPASWASSAPRPTIGQAGAPRSVPALS